MGNQRRDYGYSNAYNPQYGNYPDRQSGYQGPHPLQGYNNNRQHKKHSGCGSKMGKNDKHTIYGWNYQKGRGMLKFVAQPTGAVVGEAKGSTRNVDESKHMYIVNLTFQKTGETRTVNGVYNTQSQKLYIPALGMVANFRAPNGGYFGTSSPPKR